MVRPRETELSDFGRFLLELCDRAGQSVYEVGLKAGLKTKSRITYAMRIYGGKTRATKLSEAELQRLADGVMATEDERSLLVLLGLKEHLPRLMRKYVESIERENRTFRRQQGLPEKLLNRRS